MRSLTKTELVLAQNICERFEEIGMFDSENGYDEPEEYYDNVDCYTGATRMCFITDELPGWVIKVNFKGIKFDYCKREAENYADALSKGLEGYFASTYKVYECADGRVVTVQEEVVVDEEAITDSWYEYMRSHLDPEDYDSEEQMNDDVWDAIYDMDDYDRVEAIFGGDRKLHDFLYEHHINDLHDGNWGTSDYSGLVILDFAGYGF